MKYYKIENGIAVYCQEDINGFDGLWIQALEGFDVGDLYDEIDGWSHPVKTTQELENEARDWRNSELKKTDFIIQITDYPNYSDWVTYRENLRNWPDTDDFPETEPNAPTEL